MQQWPIVRMVVAKKCLVQATPFLATHDIDGFLIAFHHQGLRWG